jgi:hypothetical protein
MSDRFHAAGIALLDRYPLATLADLYKSFFQDEFGPGHLLADEAGALSYLDRELESTVSRRRYECEPCGLGRRYCRASLDLVVDDLVDRKRFVALFLRGADGFTLPDVDRWSVTWASILDSLRPLRSRIARFDEDAERIAGLLRRGEYAMHHSARYRDAYDPHYRIMRCEDARALATPEG